MKLAANNSTTPPGIHSPASRFVRLDALGPVGLNSSACLHLHKPWVACRRCAEVCPPAALRLDAGGVSLDANSCSGCGRCAVACPTAALAVDGFALPELSGPRAVITCRAGAAGIAGVTVVPCLGGLSAAALLPHFWRNPELRLELVDGGQCPHCTAKAGEVSALRQLAERLQDRLVSCGLAADRVTLTTRRVSLPLGNQPPSTSDQARPARRAFFSGLGRAVSQAVVQQASGTSPLGDPASLPRQPRDAIAYVGGHQTRRLMIHLAARAGTVPKWAELPQVSVSDRCRAHHGCSRLCPTGALRSSLDRHSRVLSFDAWLCIDCGACATACPEDALTYEPRAWRAFDSEPQLLSRVAQHECTRCGEFFASADGSDLCPHCRKSVALSRAGFSLFEGLRQVSRHETGPPAANGS